MLRNQQRMRLSISMNHICWAVDSNFAASLYGKHCRDSSYFCSTRRSLLPARNYNPRRRNKWSKQSCVDKEPPEYGNVAGTSQTPNLATMNDCYRALIFSEIKCRMNQDNSTKIMKIIPLQAAEDFVEKAAAFFNKNILFCCQHHAKKDQLQH